MSHWLDRLAMNAADRRPLYEPDELAETRITRRRSFRLALGAGVAAAINLQPTRFLSPTPPAAAAPDCEGNLYACLNAVEPDVAGIFGCFGLPSGPKVNFGNWTSAFKEISAFAAKQGFKEVAESLPIVGQAVCFGLLAVKNFNKRSACYDTFVACSESGGGAASGPPSTPVGSPYPPGQQPAGCGCAPGDTCCNCGPGALATLCCIYGDCRCCPGGA
jgi:hypothetical protein